MSKISCIVPVYNVEKYLSQCIDSILTQTFTDFELILIDDGSTDNSGKICDDYAKNDKRIKVIHQKNAGVGATRNAGIDVSCGEYICFVDSDDWVDEDYFKSMYDVAQETGADIVVCGYRSEELENPLVANSKRIIKEYSFVPDGKDKIFYERKEFLEKFPRLRVGKKINGAALNVPWMRLIKHFPENAMPKFNETLKCGEDCLFNLELYKKINSICYIKSILYNYRYNQNSLSRAFSEKRISDEFFMLDETESFFRNFCSKGSLWFFYKYFNAYLFSHAFALFENASNKLEGNAVLLLDAVRERIKIKSLLASFFSIKQTLFLMLIKMRLYKVAGVIFNVYIKIMTSTCLMNKNTTNMTGGV